MKGEQGTMTKWNLLLVWNVVLTVAVGWAFLSGMWGVGKQLEQISQATHDISYNMGLVHDDLWHILLELEYQR